VLPRLRREENVVSDMLRVDPHRLAAVREAYDEALNELGPQLTVLAEAGHIQTPWLGDGVSEDVRTQYNAKVMESDHGAYQAMLRYEIELKAARDQFAEMERAYLAAESANADRAPRME
jgi:hypothetical protein